tara:strand:+ start:69 stop:536 length:468 start_codon:yes stop_codon:yes gene_type:complete
MFFRIKNHFQIYFIVLFLILPACQFQQPYKNHGIIYLENRAKKLVENKSNKNDVIQIIGQPHTKSLNNDKEWFYFERIFMKGEYHKLGRNLLKSNNVLIVEFDKFGVLKNKVFLDKSDLKKIKFSEEITENNLTQKSFVQKLLTSIKEKMYSNRK